MSEESAAPSVAPASPGGGSLPSDSIAQSSTPAEVGGGDEFFGLDPSFDDDGIETLEIPETVTEQPQQVATPETPVVPPQAPPPEAPPAATPPAQVPQQTQQPTQAAAEQPQRTLSEELDASRGALIDALAAEKFALSPQEVEALEADAIGAMPKIMSRVYYEAMRGVVNHIQNNVPQLIRHMMGVMNTENQAEQAFFQKFPVIDRSKHSADIANFARAFRQQNPRMTQDELFSLVGTAVMAKYGLVGQPKPNGAAQPQPFVPARPGASVKVIPDDGSNPWSGLGQDFDD